MRKNASIVAAVFFAVLLAAKVFFSMSAAAQTATPENNSPNGSALQAQIQDRSKQLEEVNKKIAETQESLKTTTNQKNSLQKELKSIDYTISQLKLNIQADEINLDKLGLEIQSLNSDMQNIEQLMAIKKAAIAEVIREMQKSSSANVLIEFLKHTKLADGVFAAQALSDLNTQLTNDIQSLKDLRSQLTQKSDEVSQKHTETALHHTNLVSRQVIVKDQETEKKTLLTQTKNQEKAYQDDLKELAKQQEAIASEIEAIESQLRKNIDPTLLPIAQPGVFAMPVPGGRISQDYGATTFALSSYRGQWHNGVDIAAPLGTPIIAAEDGTVVAVGDQDKYCYRGAYGKYVVLNHENNLTTLYGHMSLQAVKVGQVVTRGTVIGYIGKTGYATGPHLHFTVFAQSTFAMRPSRTCGPMPVGGDLNPMKYMASM